jgi:hypothetical protein
MRTGANCHKSVSKPASARRTLNEVVFGPWVTCLAGWIFVLSVLGCMSINIGGHGLHDGTSCSEESGLLVQEGKVFVRPGNVQVVHYPTAFASPPNLEVEDPSGLCDVVEQKETCFTVRFRVDPNANQQSLSWKARGQRIAQPAAATSAPAADATSTAVGQASVQTLTPTLAQPR